MKVKRISLDENRIRALERKAMGGDKNAYKKLVDYNATYIKRANDRMKNLEKQGYDYYAYDRASAYAKSVNNGKPRFTSSQVKLGDAQGIAQSLREARAFLTAKSGTVTGQKKIEETRIQYFKDYYDKLAKKREQETGVAQEFLFDTKEEEKEFLKFLGSKDIAKGLEKMGKTVSETVVDAIRGKLVEEVLTEDEILDMFTEYKNSKLKYDVLLNKLGIEL